MFHKYRRSSLKVFCKNVVLDSFTKFTRKYLCQSLSLKSSRLQDNEKANPKEVFSCEFWKIFKNIYFGELLQVAVTTCFNRERKIKQFQYFSVFALLHQWIFGLAQKNLIYQLSFLFTWPILTNQVPYLARLNYKSSLNIHVKAPNKKLICIHNEIAPL